MGGGNSIPKNIQGYKRANLGSFKKDNLGKFNSDSNENKNPRVFFSYGWDNAWRANQIRNQSEIDTNEKASFVNRSLKEKSKATSDKYIKEKIRIGIDNSGTVAIINSNGLEQRKYARYEMEYAIKKNKKMIVINTHQMKDQKGNLGIKTSIPGLCKEYHIPEVTYIPSKSNLKDIVLGAKRPSKNRRRT